MITVESITNRRMGMAKKDFTSISIRFDEETYLRLKKIAALEERPVANVMYKWCREKIEEYCANLKEGCPPLEKK